MKVSLHELERVEAETFRASVKQAKTYIVTEEQGRRPGTLLSSTFFLPATRFAIDLASAGAWLGAVTVG